MIKKIGIFCITALMFFPFPSKGNILKETKNSNLYLLIGTYNAGSKEGIYVYRFNTLTGENSYVSETKGISNPSYLTVSRNEKFVYAVSENEVNKALAYSFSFNKQAGKLIYLNEQKTNGADPCYINTDPTGRYVITANYSGGNISVFKTKKNGALLPANQVINFEEKNKENIHETQSHLHCVAFTPDGKYLFADDLGKDQIHKFKVRYPTKESDSAPFLQVGEPSAYKVEKGSGPRHLTFHPNGKFAYLINELSGKVTVFQYHGGALKSIQYIASDTTSGTSKKGSADIHMTPNGKFLYTSNRLKADGIAIFKVNQSTGKLTKVGYQLTGTHPRNFIITPNGKFLLVANRDSNFIQIFTINAENGLLKDTEKIIKIDRPVCLKFATMK